MTTDRLSTHLAAWLGQWPPRAPVDVIGCQDRDEPGWDGNVHRLVGVSAPDLGAVLSVSPEHVDAVRAVAGDLDRSARAEIAGIVGGAGFVVGRGVFRWAVEAVDEATLPDAGEWVDRDDSRVPDWLKPFNGGVLIAWDDDGAYGAGVGVKAHDEVGREIAVVTEERLRGRGLARRLVAQATRAIVRDGGVATYLHAPDNVASARVADAAGFPDRGWHVFGLFGAED